MSTPFFKNLLIYRLSRDIVIVQDGKTEELARQLENFQFTQLFHLVNDQLLLVIRREEKILPKLVIAEELNKKVSKLETDQGRRLKKTEKDSLRDEVLHSLLPRAFTRSSMIRIWVNLNAEMVMVDTSSARRAEDSLALLRKTLGSLPVVPLTMETPIEITLTEWVRNASAPSGFALGDEAELKAILEDGGIGRFKKQELSSDEIATHLDAGKLVTQLSLDWQQRISFVLSDAAAIKRLRFADELRDQNDDIDREDAAARFDADFILMTSELTALLNSLTTALGGEAQR